MYQPTHDELIEMGFSPQEWEGQMYSYEYKSLMYCVSGACPWKHTDKPDEKYPYWTLGSWYDRWCPESKDDVMAVIRGFSLITDQK